MEAMEGRILLTATPAFTGAYFNNADLTAARAQPGRWGDQF